MTFQFVGVSGHVLLSRRKIARRGVSNHWNQWNHSYIESMVESGLDWNGMMQWNDRE